MACSIRDLPEDVFYKIFEQLPPHELLVTTMVSKLWYTFASDNKLWIPIGDVMQIAYKKDDMAKNRVVGSCKLYSHAAQGIVDYKDKNIIFQALGRRLLVHSKREIHNVKMIETILKHPFELSYLRPPSYSNTVIQAFIPLFEEKKKEWLSKHADKLPLVLHIDDKGQELLKTEFFNLCRQFKEEAPSDKEIEDIFYLFQVRGLQVSIQCFKSFKSEICQHPDALKQLAELVLNEGDVVLDEIDNN